MSDTPDITQHYSAETTPRGFWIHALPVVCYPQRAWRSRELVWNFYRREMLGRFRGSVGGMGWVLVQPIFQFCVYFLIFGILFANPKDLLSKGPSEFFALYLFSGIIVFNTISEGINRGLTAVTENANLVKKVAFPSELLPLTPTLTSVTIFAVSSAVLFVVGLALGQVHLTWSLLLWPVVVLVMAVFCTGFGLLLACAQVFARDVQHLWRIISLAWFFVSPVFWKVNMVQEKADAFGAPWFTNLALLNPMYPILLAQRQVFGIGLDLPAAEYDSYFPMSVGAYLLIGAAWACFMLFVGYGFYMMKRRDFADLV